MSRAHSALRPLLFIWSPKPPLTGAIILALAATVPIYAAADLVPAMLALPLILIITSLVLWSSASLFSSDDGARPTRLDAVRRFSSTTSRKSIYDLETGFCADWYFMLRLEEEVARTKRGGPAFGLLLIEPIGEPDTALRTRMLLVLERTFRTADLVGRLGDLRFGVLLPDSDHEGSRAAQERLEKLLGHKNIRVTLTVRPHGEIDWKTLLSEGADSRFPSAEPIWTPDERSVFDRESRSA